MKRGYLYITYELPYAEEAVISAESLKKNVPDAHVTLITRKEIADQLKVSRPKAAKCFDNIQLLDFDESYPSGRTQGFMYKVYGIQHSPYDDTFFIDSDTYFCDSCEELWELLDFFDMLVTPVPADVNLVKRDGKMIQGYYPYNTGVIVFRKSDRMEKFLLDWRQRFIEKYRHCQPPFVDALLDNPVRAYCMLPIYNFRMPFFVALPPLKVKIIHGRPDNFARIDRIINKNHKQSRAWNPLTEAMEGRDLPLRDSDKSKPLKFIRSVRNWLG